MDAWVAGEAAAVPEVAANAAPAPPNKAAVAAAVAPTRRVCFIDMPSTLWGNHEETGESPMRGLSSPGTRYAEVTGLVA
jgi:hypothetical protein